MSGGTPEWVPEVAEGLTPRDQQSTIVESESYPMRVLAGAGTGKTFTMVQKIAHLVEEQGVSPDRILALTFTNNAADSMREKLNARLGTAGYDVDAYTYHSICNDILGEYAYEAGVDPDFDVATDAERYAVVLDVLDEIEYRDVKPNVYGPDSYADGAASELLSFVSSTKRSGLSPADVDEFLGDPERLYECEDLPDRIEAAASDHLGGRSVSSVLDGVPEMRAAIEDERDALGTTGFEVAVADCLDRLVDLCDALEDAFEAELHSRGEDGDDAGLPDAAHKLPKYLLGGYKSGAPAGIPDSVGVECTDHLREFLGECKLACDLNPGYAAYERELDARDRMDFDGLVTETVSFLDTAVGEAVGDRWDYVFCDEFQDTDRLQFDLVTSLVSDERLFVVGDDDQAIYEWRGAHVSNITDELDEAFGASLTDEPLAENFRSRQPILDLANDALERLDGRQSAKTLDRVDEPAYEGTTVATIEEGDDEDVRADQLVTTAQNLLSGDADELDSAYDPGDIALLVRKNDHATPILDAFERAGIPYQVSGSLNAESVGVRTVVAYLKALARPRGDDVSWNRVLAMRYRLRDADLRRVNAHDDGTLDGLLETPLGEFEEPARVAAAREHATELLELAETASLAHLYRELLEVTDLEWYLSEQERRDLAELESVVEGYGEDAVQPPLTPEFVDSLAHYDSLFDESGAAPTSDPALADDAVNVMTVHKSKGLDFPVVLVPRLTADEWEPSSRTYDALETALSDGPRATFGEDFVARDARETRRILHVALTRAEDVLVLQGSADEDEAGEDAITEELTALLPSSVAWQPASSELPIWADVRDCLPADAVDWTDTLAATAVGDTAGTITHESRELTATDARERVLEFASRALDGTLDVPDGERGGDVLAVDALAGPSTPAPRIQHSYTSLEAFEACPRQHYLEYVVNAFEDYDDGERTEDDSSNGDSRAGSSKTAALQAESTANVSQRTVGVLFHDTAELAARENATTPEAWYDVCERLAGQRRQTDALPRVRACIDRYFDLDVSDWTVVDAEREFELDVDGHELVGYVDAVYRTPADELVVLDYKATERSRDIGSNHQLPIYLLACRDLYDEPVRCAGYAYVGPTGPAVETRTFDDRELDSVRANVAESMAAIEDATFGQYAAGPHCQWCAHSELPCADDRR